MVITIVTNSQGSSPHIQYTKSTASVFCVLFSTFASLWFSSGICCPPFFQLQYNNRFGITKSTSTCLTNKMPNKNHNHLISFFVWEKLRFVSGPRVIFVRLSGNKSWRHQFASCSVNERRRTNGAHVLCLHSLECNNSASAPTFRVHVIWPIEVSYIDEHTIFLFHLLLFYFYATFQPVVPRCTKFGTSCIDVILIHL